MKKHLSAIVVGLLATFGAQAQWTTSGTNIYNTNTGNVGIGTTTPYTWSRLHVKAPGANPWGILAEASTGDKVIGMSHDGTNGVIATGYLSTAGFTPLQFQTSTLPRMTIDANGKVSIGATPINSTNLFQLNYSSNVSSSGAVIRNSNSGNVAYAELSMYNDINSLGQLYFTSSGYSAVSAIRANAMGLYSGGTGGISFVTDGSGAPITFTTGGSSSTNNRMTITTSGNIGIGTANPDQLLTVKGIIHSQEVRVDLNVAGPDYVFEKNYKLPTLEAIKTYIDQNKHLPEVPAAAEMEKNGVQLGEMNMLLLKKVEELTLYVIELKKRDEAQQKEIEGLKKGSLNLKLKE